MIYNTNYNQIIVENVVDLETITDKLMQVSFRMNE